MTIQLKWEEQIKNLYLILKERISRSFQNLMMLLSLRKNLLVLVTQN